MSDLFYLDTARYGRMCDRARRAADDLNRLSAAEGCSSSFERLLREGFDAWPFDLRHEYRGLCDWGGVCELTRELRRFAGAGPTAEVLFAQRSAALLAVGLGAAFARCRRILTTDLDWPPYREAVSAAAAGHGAGVECVPLRDLVFRDRASPDDVIAVIRDYYRRAGCDGLFLTSVTNTGVRLPARDVVQALTRSAGRPRFVLVDGTQALGHVPEVLRDAPFDFYLAGCHKWLRAQHPLAVAVFAEPLTGQLLRRSITENNPGELIDPLLVFTRQLEGCKGNLPRFGETVNVTPLFTARAALADPTAGALWTISLNRRQIENAVVGTGWERLATHQDLSSGIQLYRPTLIAARSRTADVTRAGFHQHGVSLTAYDGGIVRLSIPKALVPERWHRLLWAAMAATGGRRSC